MNKKRIIALILSVAMLCNIMPMMQLFASATEAINVYVNASSGNDSNAGTEQSSAFKTLSKAMTTINNASNNSGVINIIGTYTLTKKRELGTYTKPITIQGVDGTNAAIHINTGDTQFVLGGTTFFDNITFKGITSGKNGVFMFRTERSAVTLGNNVNMDSGSDPTYWPYVVTGAYGNTTANTSPGREALTIDNAKLSAVYLGNNSSMTSVTNSNISAGVDYIQNGGSVYKLNLGTSDNGTDTYCLATKYIGNVNITINGGTIGTANSGGILSSDGSKVEANGYKTNFNGNAVQIIFNNDTISNVLSGNIPSQSDIEAKNGKLYLLSCSTGGTLSMTGTAGTYTVNSDKFAAATDKSDSSKVYYSKDGELTVPSGSYDVTWTDSLESWEITSEDENGACIVPTDYDNMFNLTVPADKLAAAYDKDNNIVYVADDKSVADKTPKTDYQSTKYTDWGCFDNNGSYLTNTYNKLTKDKELTVVYFGGSLTNGYGCGENGDPTGLKANGVTRHEYSWRALSGKWLKAQFPDATINTVDAAIGESGTFLGTYRVQADIIAQNPDLLFVEYAINDTYYGSTKESAALQFETVIREVKQALPDCDIVVVLTTDKTFMSTTYAGNLFDTAAGHKEIADAYGLPVVNIGLGLAKGIAEQENNTSWWSSTDIWNKYFCDNVHPYSTGHEQYYLCIEEYLENNLKHTTHSEITRDNLPVVQSEYLLDGNRLSIYGADMKDYYVSGTNANYNTGTFVTGTSDTPREGYYEVAADGSITFEFTGTEFTVWSNLKKDFSYSVDNGATTAVNASSHAPTRVVSGLESRTHKITITPSAAMQIAGIFVRDESVQTVKGTSYEHVDYKGMTLALPAGNYHVYYVSTVGELPKPSVAEGTQFMGWKDTEGNRLSDSELLVKGMKLTAEVEDVCTVYLSVNGNDSNSGAEDAPFATLYKAIQVIKASGKKGVINIIGTFDVNNEHRKMQNYPYSKMITIQGANEDAVIYFSTSTVYFGGPLTLDNIKVKAADTVVIDCAQQEFVVGKNAKFEYVNNDVSKALQLVTGVYGGYTVSTTNREAVTLHGGVMSSAYLGNRATLTGSITESAGVDFVVYDCIIDKLWVGSDGWSTGNLGHTKYKGDVNFTMFGGTVNGIRVDNTSVGIATEYNNNAVQLIFNNGTKVVDASSIPTVETIAAKGGELFIMNCAMQGGTSYLTATDEAGVYQVHGKLKAVATDESGNEYESINGVLTVPKGIYNVAWALDDSPITVYVDETNGSDSNKGLTSSTAFKTLNAAIDAIQNSSSASGIITIVGKLTIDDSTQSKTLSAHTKMITIMGQNSSSAITLSKTVTTNGPLTIQNIAITLTTDYIGFDHDTYEFNLGEKITNKAYPYMEVMSGPNNSNCDKLEVSMGSGNVYRIVIGSFVNTSGTDEIKGLDYVHNGGQLTTLYLGSNAWEQENTQFYSTAFTENVNITLNGGQVGEISLLKPIEGSVSQSNRDVYFKKAVQILINDGGYLASDLPDFNAEGGLWILNGHGSGYNLEMTETAGVYQVPEGITAIAYSEDGTRTYVSEEGILTISEPGNYTLEYKEVLDYTNSGTVIKFYQNVTVDSIGEFAVKDVDNKLFAGWLNESEEAVTGNTFNPGTVLTAKFIDYTFAIEGTQIRETSDAQAMRVVVELSDSVSDEFATLTYGAVYALNKVLGTKELAINGSYAYDGSTYVATTVNGTEYDSTEDSILYATVIDNISPVDYQVPYAVKGFITYSDLNAVSRTVYTKEMVTSVADVAEKLLTVDAKDSSVQKIVSTGKEAIQEKYSGQNAVTAENIITGTIGSNFNNGTILGKNGQEAMKFYQLDGGLTVRDVTINAVNGNSSNGETTVVQISDPHFNYANEQDIAEGNPSTLSTWNYRDLNKLWNGALNKSIYNFANSMEYASAYADKTIITGDVIDYISYGNIALMKRYINTPYSDAMVLFGNHDPIRVMGLPNDVPDATKLTSRYDMLQKDWNNDVYYTSEIINDEVMVIQLDNSQNKFWASQIPLLTNDLAKAREDGLTVLVFMHIPVLTLNSADTAVEALIGMDGTKLNFYNYNNLIGPAKGPDTKAIYELITSYGDVIKGIFSGHTHSDYYTEVLAKDAAGNDTYIPQYVLTGNFYGKGHVLKITVK